MYPTAQKKKKVTIEQYERLYFFYGIAGISIYFIPYKFYFFADKVFRSPITGQSYAWECDIS